MPRNSRGGGGGGGGSTSVPIVNAITGQQVEQNYTPVENKQAQSTGNPYQQTQVPQNLNLSGGSSLPPYAQQVNLYEQQRRSELKETPQENPVDAFITNTKTDLDYYKISNPVVGNLALVPIGFVESGVDLVKLGYNVATNPVGTVFDVTVGIATAVSQPEKTIREFSLSVIENPGTSAGRLAGDVLIPKYGLTLASKANIAVRSAVTPLRTGFVEIPAEQVLDLDVLSGAKFPTSKSPAQALIDFKQGQQIDGSLLSVNARPVAQPSTITAGERGLAMQEDIVQFVAPYERGSPNFLRLGGVDYSGGLSLNPLNIVNPFKGDPTINIFKSEGIKTIPESIIQTAKSGDFTQVNKFLLESADRRSIYQTARSTLGQTSEAEAGVIAGTRANVEKPFAYINIEGKNVPVQLVDITVPQNKNVALLENKNVKTKLVSDIYESSNYQVSKSPVVFTVPTTNVSSGGSSGVSAPILPRVSGGSSRGSSGVSAPSLPSYNVGSSGDSSRVSTPILPSVSGGSSRGSSGVSTPSLPSYNGGLSGGSSGVSAPSLPNYSGGASMLSTPVLPKYPIVGYKRSPSQKQNKFTAQIRRRGKFINVGVYGESNIAFQRGQSIAQSTLARSFRVLDEQGR